MAKKKNPERQKKFFIAGMVTFAVVATIVYFMRSDRSIPDSLYDSGETVVTSATFLCSDGNTISTQFQGRDANVRLPDGRLYTLAQTPPEEEGRYANSDGSIVLWNSNDMIALEENETTVYSDCVAQ